MFTLNQKLKHDTAEIARLELSLALLMKDSSFPWLILVPQQQGIQEIYDLAAKDRAVLIEEITLASQIIKRLYTPDKINIGALGNIVPQLHIHVIGRFKTDRAWPGAVWDAAGSMKPYSEDELKTTCARFQQAFHSSRSL